jgi:superfamily I DNA/RNA helicase
VDNHDNAYRRAARSSFVLEDGVVKIRDVIRDSTPASSHNGHDSNATQDWLLQLRDKPGKLFIGYTDTELTEMGVDADHIPHVRALDDINELEYVERLLDENTFDALLSIILGESEREAVPDTYLHKSLRKNHGGEDLYQFINSEEFQRALDGDLEGWMLFLAPHQQQLVRRYFNGPARVKGVAGSGKTVIAIHRTYHMYQMAEKHDVAVLFLTFGNRLPAITHYLLQRLAGTTPLENHRLACMTLHQWCSRFLAEHGERPQVDFRLINSALRDAIKQVKPYYADLTLWNRSLDFFKEEISASIKGRAVRSMDAYLALDRSGRGTALRSREREAVYNVYQHYDRLLAAEGKCDFDDFVIRALTILEQNPDLQGQYRSVVVDEVQDFTEAALRLVKLLVPDEPNNLFLVGDGLQRIYRGGFSLRSLGIEVVGRSSVLRRNYRNTQQILHAAYMMMRREEVDDMDNDPEEVVEPIYSVRSGPLPELRTFTTPAAEVTWIRQQIQELIAEENYETRDNAIFYRYRAPYHDELGAQFGDTLPLVELDKHAETYFGDGVKHTTFHSAKGLEFKAVFVLGVADGIVPREQYDFSAEEQAEAIATERRLLYVAMTRARDLLYLTVPGPRASRFLDDVTDEVMLRATHA